MSFLISFEKNKRKSKLNERLNICLTRNIVIVEIITDHFFLIKKKKTEK